MIHHAPSPPARTFNLNSFCTRIIMAAIRAHGISDSDRKERIMLARQYGFLSDEAAEDYIVFWGLLNA